VHLALSTCNNEFLPSGTSIGYNEPGRVGIPADCASGRRLGSQHCCFGSANRDDSFYGKTFDVSYSTFLISFENQTQVCHLG